MVPGFFVGGFGGCQSCLVQGFGIIHGVIFSISCSLRIQDTKNANQKNPVLKEKAHQKTMFTTRCPSPFPIPLSLPLQTDSLPKKRNHVVSKTPEIPKTRPSPSAYTPLKETAWTPPALLT